ncbi:MAG: 50S ribosomal protein L19 [Planctomycetes bacterium]|nr:50S ribosomal protein L19 [Planctomycetota bacterium]
MKRAGIQRIEAAYLVKDRPDFHIGDTVDVGVRIMEGDKERVQVFTGVVIARRGHGAPETFSVRRIVAGEGVERTWPLHCPAVSFIRVVRSGRVRRAKLTYLRKRVGKATRLVEERRELGEAGAAGAPEGAGATAAEAT